MTQPPKKLFCVNQGTVGLQGLIWAKKRGFLTFLVSVATNTTETSTAAALMHRVVAAVLSNLQPVGPLNGGLWPVHCV